MDHRTVTITDDLHLDMAGTLNEALDDHRRVTEGALRLGLGLSEGRSETLRLVDDADPLAAPTGGRLHQHRIPDGIGRLSERLRVLGLVEPGDDRHTGRRGQTASLDLGTHHPDRLGPRTDPTASGIDDGLGEGRVLRQEPVAGMHRVGTRLGDGGEQTLHREIARCEIGGTEVERHVGLGDEGGRGVGVGEHGDRRVAEGPGRPDDAAGDLPAVGDQDPHDITSDTPAGCPGRERPDERRGRGRVRGRRGCRPGRSGRRPTAATWRDTGRSG